MTAACTRCVIRRDAFAARMELARAAQRSLDLQYYLWHGDLTGTLLLQAVHQAAERGVRVRLLLDDNNTVGLDTTLAALDVHRHIEVRLFNPFTLRGARWLDGLTDFARLNRRMHNKSFTVDNQATIVGGRNIGNEYFGATDALLFSDLDVLAVGPVAQAVSADFDRYWQCASAVPLARLLPPATPAELQALAALATRIEHSPQASVYVAAVEQSSFVESMRQNTLEMQWVPTLLISDDPAKALGKARPETLFPVRLRAALGRPERELDLISPYFRTRCDRRRRPRRVGRCRREDPRADQCAGEHRCDGGARRLCQAPARVAARRHHAVRTAPHCDTRARPAPA